VQTHRNISPPHRKPHGAICGPMRGVLDRVAALAGSILLLPALAAWYLLYRWSPDPP